MSEGCWRWSPPPLPVLARFVICQSVVTFLSQYSPKIESNSRQPRRTCALRRRASAAESRRKHPITFPLARKKTLTHCSPESRPFMTRACELDDFWMYERALGIAVALIAVAVSPLLVEGGQTSRCEVSSRQVFYSLTTVGKPLSMLDSD